LLFKEPDDFTCYTQMISYYSKPMPAKLNALQVFIVALKATIFIMKRQAAVFLQTQMASPEFNFSKKEKLNLSISCDVSQGLSFIEDSVSESNLQVKPLNPYTVEVHDIIISSKNNRELHNRDNNGTSARELVDPQSQLLDKSVSSLFKKIKEGGKRRSHVEKSYKLLNRSY